MASRLKSCLWAGMAVLGAATYSGSAAAWWVWTANGYYDVAAVNYQGQQQTIVFDRHSAQGSPFGVVTMARNELYSVLRSQFDAGVYASVSRGEGYRWHKTWMNGPIELGITPTPGSPYPTVSVSGLSAGFQVHTRNAKLGLTVECDIWVETGPMSVGGKLDIGSGLIHDLQLHNLQPRFSRHCSSNVSWLPGLDSLLTNYAEGLIDQSLKGNLQGALTMVQGTFRPVQFSGLHVSIPDNRYVFNGVDVGRYIRNNLPSLIANANVTVRFYDPPMYSLNGRPAADGRERDVDDPVMAINFASQGISFALTERTHYTTSWYCPPNQTGGCQVP